MKPKQVKDAMKAVVDLAAKELKKNGSFMLLGILKMKLATKAAMPARKGWNPFTKDLCVWKAKPASMKVKVSALKKLKAAVN